MSALIYIDLEHVHPIIDGVWHRAHLLAMPDPGQEITMLCGAIAPAEYHRLDERRQHGIPTECPRCDLLYRRRHNIPLQQERIQARPAP